MSMSALVSLLRAGEMCKNTEGSFECITNPLCTQASHLHAVQFGCGNIACPHGTDCITIDGIARCADPCEHYSVLNDNWRSTDFVYVQGQAHCDRYVNCQGWYRFYLNGSNAQIPEVCVEEHRCGTHAQMSLTAPHPTQSNYIESRDICATYYSTCCYFDTPNIQVKRCYGLYYVYKLVKPTSFPTLIVQVKYSKSWFSILTIVCLSEHNKVFQNCLED